MQTVHFPFSFASRIVLPTFGYWSDMHPIPIFLSSLEYPEPCQYDSCTYITAARMSWSFDSPSPPSFTHPLSIHHASSNLQKPCHHHSRMIYLISALPPRRYPYVSQFSFSFPNPLPPLSLNLPHVICLISSLSPLACLIYPAGSKLVLSPW